jgi:hypothetical protein
MGHATEIWQEGDTAVLRITWTDPESVTAPVGEDGHTLFTPAACTLTIEDPTGTQTTPSVTNESQGVYRGRVQFTTGGLWIARWYCSGTGYSRAVEFEIPVQNSRVV